MTISNKKITVIITLVIAIVLVIFDVDINVNNESNKKVVTAEETFLVVRVIDGDTFEINTGQKVRMIGMDTPERGEYFFKEATDRLKELIGNKEVVLKKDVSETDRYGRLLRHVYYDGIWINKKMIDDGFAKFVTFPPDVYHVEEFKEAQRQAKKNKVGLWDK